ncbi:sensor histidine kinase [Aureliella helgolandensis]|uniref:histidine kinase n=1 Tax=Aureliella helgolandensis TaxID=2527968 RepID=A0A518GE83_9BACT|nr:HAMP domain-containing sensor histidine kinase [Aureliella helgolandensis]QDV26870.1 Sensor histidine kinase RegB [Aureliella helgolandensis]
MGLSPLIRPHVHAHPTLDTAIWYLHLRWVAVAGQLLTMLAVAWGLKIQLPNWELLGLIGITAISNVAYAFWLSHLHRGGLEYGERLPTDQVVSSLMLVDILVLSGMLYHSAGLANPFALFYFVNVAVAGAILTPAWAWGIWGATVACVTLLLIHTLPLAELSNVNQLAASDPTAPIWTIPKLGFLVSFATCSGVITYFITILTGELRQREQALQEAEGARVRNRQLEALATLAAGAGHELANPLSTIAVVAKELSRALEKQNAPEAVLTDVALIRSELDRCRQILDRMTSTAGEAAGEQLQSVTIDTFLCETTVGLREPGRVQIKIDEQVKTLTNLLPVQAAAQAVRNVIQNALDASQPGAEVAVSATRHQSHWKILVVDRGDGMPADVMARIGEPFFTTKEPGRGMGLGLYLTQNVLRRLNGSLDFESKPGHGTTATVILPTQRN